MLDGPSARSSQGPTGSSSTCPRRPIKKHKLNVKALQDCSIQANFQQRVEENLQLHPEPGTSTARDLISSLSLINGIPSASPFSRLPLTL